jgi:putative iron-regulated protein
MRKYPLLVLSLALVGCQGGGSSEATEEAVATTYANLVHAAYQASLDSAIELQGAVDAFLSDPNEASLSAARQAWLTARDDYAPTEAFRFYDGPIDNPDDGPEGRINAWPMDEAYVDYVEGDPDAGIINDPEGFTEITVDLVVAANEQGGETNISTGWHAIEFLLWGQDLDPDGPGARPATDYTTSPNADRRATYLRIVTDLLIADLESVRAQWDPNVGTYRTSFLADPAQAIESMLRGIGALIAGELAGERMAVAYETRDQEDEHSCFSDNTNADVVGDLRGVEMVYLAEFPGVIGPSLSDLVEDVDPDLDATMRAQIERSLELTSAFPATFDQMIAADDGEPGRNALLEALTAIEEQGETIARIADALGKTITLEV